jgi:hypothetical protein
MMQEKVQIYTGDVCVSASTVMQAYIP